MSFPPPDMSSWTSPLESLRHIYSLVNSDQANGDLTRQLEAAKATLLGDPTRKVGRVTFFVVDRKGHSLPPVQMSLRQTLGELRDEVGARDVNLSLSLSKGVKTPIVSADSTPLWFLEYGTRPMIRFGLDPGEYTLVRG